MVNNYAAGQSDTRPWGDWTVLDAGPGYAVKRIRVRPDGVLFVNGSADLYFEDVAAVIDIAHGAGVERIGVLTDKTSAASQR